MHALNQNSLLVIYLGFFFCLCIAMFNAYTIFANFTRHKTEEKRIAWWKRFLDVQMREYGRSRESAVKLKKQFQARLHFDNTLLYLEPVFDNIFSNKLYDEKKVAEMFHIWFSVLISKYGKSEKIVIVYLTFLIGKYRIESAAVNQFLMDRLIENDMESSEEAFYTICRKNEAKLLRRALMSINRNDVFLSKKVISDALGDFNAPQELLEKTAFADFLILNPPLEVSIIEFMNSHLSEEFKNLLLKLMHEMDTDKEVRIAILKYYGRVFYSPALDILLEYAKSPEWEYAAIAAKSLVLYPGEKTIVQAKSRLSDPSWYIRYNNAMTLVQIAQEKDIQEELASSDRYAREITNYALEKIKQERGNGDGGTESAG